MFSGLPDVYERVNHILTLGLDVVWRRRLISSVEVPSGGYVLDVCSGTGETAIYLRERYPGVMVTALDFSEPMLRRLVSKPAVASGGIRAVLGDAGRLPFGADRFDLVTVSFATRNLSAAPGGLDHIFREFLRVLRPGGWYVNLETSQPRFAAWRWIFHGMTGAFVAPVGRIFAGGDGEEGYDYLSRSIRGFMDADALAERMRDAGFETVAFERLLGGVAAIHRGRKAGAPGEVRPSDERGLFR